MKFDTAFELLMEHEGGYVNHPNDPGGETNWGVTKAVAQRYGYTGSMKDLPKETAKAIAKQEYWDKVWGDDMHPKLAYPLFDAAYHSGPPRAVKWLQQALGVEQDGVMGPKTLNAVYSLNQETVLRRMLGYRLDYLATRKHWSSFRGWFRRIASLLKT